VPDRLGTPTGIGGAQSLHSFPIINQVFVLDDRLWRPLDPNVGDLLQEIQGQRPAWSTQPS
jgi:hypothetical protein